MDSSVNMSLVLLGSSEGVFRGAEVPCQSEGTKARSLEVVVH